MNKKWFISSIPPDVLKIGDSQVGDWIDTKHFLQSESFDNLKKHKNCSIETFYAYETENHKIKQVFTLKEAIRYEKLEHL